MYARTTASPCWLTRSRINRTPYWFAATWAWRSARLSARFRAGYGGRVNNAAKVASSNWPARTRRTLSITIPSSANDVDAAGIDPGVIPPTSA